MADSKTRIKDFISSNFPSWKKVDYSEYEDNVDFDKNLSELYKIDNDEVILISYTNISITGSDRLKPQLRVFLHEYKNPFYFAKKHQLRYYLFSIFTKEDEMAKGLNNFNPKEYIISIETNLDNEGSRRDLRSIYDYANTNLNGSKFLKCTRANYNVDINQASFIYIGTPENPDNETFEAFIKIFDSRPYQNSINSHRSPIIVTEEEISKSFLPYLTALRTKPFMLLAGISGTGKSRIVRKLAQATVTEELQRANGYTGEDFANDRWTLHSPANFELIQVKPNWHNSMDVIGYLSNIPSPHYVFTPFIEFIVKAWQHPEVPFFLCLDEMNLAPVEEYFAEFLSAIESRSFEGEEYLTDPIIKPFNSFGEEVAKKMVNTLFPNFTAADKNSFLGKIVDHLETKGLTLPKNLIVIGTVNMDETTFSFSRKVLDRAMSVEMNEVNYDCFLTDTTDDDLKAIVKALEENDDADLNTLLVDRHIEAREIIDDLGDDAKFAIDYLKRINALLEGTPFKLGYRAANEALIYLQASYEFGQTDRIAALDNFTLMKILSRIEGDETKLKITDSEADKERIAKAEVNVDEAKQYGDLNILTALRHIITNQLGEQDKLHSVKKIDSMLSQLKRDHFVSFWN